MHPVTEKLRNIVLNQFTVLRLCLSAASEGHDGGVDGDHQVPVVGDRKGELGHAAVGAQRMNARRIGNVVGEGVEGGITGGGVGGVGVRSSGLEGVFIVLVDGVQVALATAALG